MEDITAGAIYGAWSMAGCTNQPATWRPTHDEVLLLVLENCWVRTEDASLQGHRLTGLHLPHTAPYSVDDTRFATGRRWGRGGMSMAMRMPAYLSTSVPTHTCTWRRGSRITACWA